MWEADPVTGEARGRRRRRRYNRMFSRETTSRAERRRLARAYNRGKRRERKQRSGYARFLPKGTYRHNLR